VRLLDGTVKVDAGEGLRRAVKLDVDQARRVQDTGRAATAQFPAFAYENDNLVFYPRTPEQSEFLYVKEADRVSNGADTIVLDQRFEAAIVYYCAMRSFQRLRRPGLENASWEQFQNEIAVYQRGVNANHMDGQEVETE
jgi:hypothetical protein